MSGMKDKGLFGEGSSTDEHKVDSKLEDVDEEMEVVARRMLVNR